MAIPFASLNAATATGSGASRDLGELSGHHTMFVIATGGASWTVAIEGSHDDVNWLSLGAVSGGSSSFATIPTTAIPGPLVRYIRANLTTLSGGSSPTITATIASDIEGES